MKTQFEITTIQTGEKQIVKTLRQVAKVMELEVEDIEWALEEEGVCETDTHRVVEIVK